eukprot:8776351-Alexandrium_andersonii.AAC.1
MPSAGSQDPICCRPRHGHRIPAIEALRTKATTKEARGRPSSVRPVRPRDSFIVSSVCNDGFK